MTQQFKFGDRVKHILTPELIGVVLSEVDEYGYVNVMFDYDLIVEDINVSWLEPIPHPDTERLDWLADPANEIGKVMLPGWCSDEYDSLRDAIDAAMQEQAAEAKAT